MNAFDKNFLTDANLVSYGAFIEVELAQDLPAAPFLNYPENLDEIKIETNSWGGKRTGSGRPSKPKKPQVGLIEPRWLCVKVDTSRDPRDVDPEKACRAELELSRKGFQSHFPRFVPALVGGKKNTDRLIRDMFPGYGFVFWQPRQDWREIKSADVIGAVKHLYLVSEHMPALIPKGIVEAFQARGRPGDGVIDENYQGPEFPRLAIGTSVKITTGPFADLHGICRWSAQKRVGLLLEVMGRQVEVTVRRNAIECLNSKD